MRRLAALALLASCAGNGVIVEVDTNGLAVTSVELVISDRVCVDPRSDGSCETIAGEGFSRELGRAGDLYFRDASATSTQLDGGIATFEIPAAERTLAMAFAIGRNAQGVIVGAAVMARTLKLAAGPIVYRVTLDPTEDLRATTRSNVAAAAEWGANRECLGVDPVHSTLDQRRPQFILPDDNPDCDLDRGPDECDPLAFNGFSVDEDSHDYCVLSKLSAYNFTIGACLLGDVPSCVEDPETKCAPRQSAICVPSSVCTCPAIDEDCQQRKLLEVDLTGEQVRVECKVSGEASPDITNITNACADGSEFTLQLPASSAICISAQLLEDPAAAFHSPQATNLSLGDAFFEIMVGEPQTCAIKMKWSSGSLPNTGTHTVMAILVEVDGDPRELWIWIPITFIPSGLAASNCPGTGPGTGSCKLLDDNGSINQCITVISSPDQP